MNEPARTATLPRLPRTAVARPRLETRLDRPTPITIVTGPAGAGKTTLVTRWLEHRLADTDELHRWVSLDPRIATASLWAALARAIDDVASGPVHAPAAGAWDRLVASVEGLTRPVRVIVDGLERRDEERPHDALVELVRRSRRLRLIVIARGSHVVQAAAAAGVETTVIGPSELRFDEEEHTRFLAAHRVELPPEQATRLLDSVGGWPALADAAAVAIRDQPGARAVEHAGRAAAERYLRDRVLPELLDEEETRLATRLAVLDRITPDAAAVATRVDDPMPLLAGLEEAGLLFAVDDEGEPVLRFPEITRSVLERQLRAEDEDEVVRLHRELATRAADEDEPVSAVDHARRGGDWELLIDLLSEHFVTLLVNHDGLLRDALDALPSDVLETRPSLRDAQTVLRDIPLRGGTAGAALPLDPTVLIEESDDHELRERVSRAFIHATALRMGGRARASVDVAARIRAVYDELEEERRRSVVDYAPVLLAQLGITRFLGADLLGAEADFLRCYAESTAAGDELFAFDSATYEALTRALLGDADGVATWLAEAEGHDFARPAPWLADLLGTSGDLAAAMVAIDRLDRDAADTALAELSDATGPDELWALISHVTTRYALLWGDPSAQLVDVGRARAAHPGRAGPGSLADLVLTTDTVDLLAATGQAHRAVRTLEQATAVHPRIEVARARLALLTGRHDEVVLAASTAVWADTTTERDRLDLLVLSALAEEARGEPEAARRAAARAVTAVRATGNLSALLMVPDGSRRHLAALIGDGVSFDGAPLAGAAEVFPGRLELVELSERERVVLEQLAGGTSLESIARTLFVSINTVKSQVRSIYRKLGASSRVDAVVRAHELGLLDAPERGAAGGR